MRIKSSSSLLLSVGATLTRSAQSNTYWMYENTGSDGTTEGPMEGIGFGPQYWHKVNQDDYKDLTFNWLEAESASIDYDENMCKSTGLFHVDTSASSSDNEEGQSPKLLQGDKTCTDAHSMFPQNNRCTYEDINYTITPYSVRADLNSCENRPQIDYSQSPKLQDLHYFELKVPGEHVMRKNGMDHYFVAELTLAHVGTSSDDNELSHVNVVYELGGDDECDSEVAKHLHFWEHAMEDMYAGCKYPLEAWKPPADLCEVRSIINKEPQPSSTPSLSLSPSGIPSGAPSSSSKAPTSILSSSEPSSLSSLSADPNDQSIAQRAGELHTSTESGSSIPTYMPSDQPSAGPSISPSPGLPLSAGNSPSSAPSLRLQPSTIPLSSSIPTNQPSFDQTGSETTIPTLEPSFTASPSIPSYMPSTQPSAGPSISPSSGNAPSSAPSLRLQPSTSSSPSSIPTNQPSSDPSGSEAMIPSSEPSVTKSPSSMPMQAPQNSTRFLAVDGSACDHVVEGTCEECCGTRSHLPAHSSQKMFLRGRQEHGLNKLCGDVDCGDCCKVAFLEGTKEKLRLGAPTGVNRQRTLALSPDDRATPYRMVTDTGSPYIYKYEGSQTHPPCYQKTEHRVLYEPRKLCPAQLDLLERMIGGYLDGRCLMATVGKSRNDGTCKVDVNRPLQFHNEGDSSVGMKECVEWNSR